MSTVRAERAAVNSGASQSTAQRQIANALSTLIKPGQRFEIRTFKAKNAGAIPRFFTADDIDAAAKYASGVSGRVQGVYFTLNPIKPGPIAGKAAADVDILRRQLLLIDTDPKRPTDTSATEAEKAEGIELCGKIRDFLREHGWPDPIEADSGNGGHLLYGIDLPNDDASRDLVRAILVALANRFNTSAVEVDTSVFNASRVCKLYGTKACKGRDVPERPHRMARLVKVPRELKPVPAELLVALVDELKPTNEGQPEFDLDAEVERKRAQGADPPPPKGERLHAKAEDWSTERRAIAYLEKCEPAVSGQRGHSKAFKAACKIGPGFDLDPDLAYRLLWEHYNPRCVPPWSEKDLRHKVDEAYKVETKRGWLRDADRNGSTSKRNGRHGSNTESNGNGHPGQPPDSSIEPPPRLPLTEMGNAERFVRRFGHQVRYCSRQNIWFAWDGKRFKEDHNGVINRMAKAATRGIGAEAAEAISDDDAKAILKWAISSETQKRRDAMVNLARSEKPIPVESEKLNANQWLLNVENGTIDLRTGKLQPHRQEDLITKIAPVIFDPTAKAPLWDSFLHRVLGGDELLIAFVKRAAGYGITGDVSEHALFFLYGTGRNGKGTFLETILRVLGDYATTIDANLLTAKRDGDHPTGLTDLDGCRFVPTEEVEDGKRMAEALVKKLTGGNVIKARRMRENNYEFNPTHKIFLAANHKPEIKGTDEGIWSRIKLIPFSVFIAPEERDLKLGEKLLAEASGILAWLVEGCLEWQRSGLAEPASVKLATAGYRAEMDAIGDFLSERCDTFLDHETLRTQAKALASAIYHAFTEWCRSSGLEAMPARKFGSELEQRGFKLEKSNGKCWRLGITVKSNGTEPDP